MINSFLNNILYKSRKHLLLAFIVFTVCSCKNDMREVAELDKQSVSVEEAVNVESYLSQNAKVKAKLTAPLMLRYQTSEMKTEFPKKLSVVFYDDNLQPESFLFANYGTYNENQQKVFLKDSVLVYNVKGDTIRTSEMWWDQNQGLFYTDKPVNVRTITPINQDVLATKGMKSDQSFRNPMLYEVISPSYAIVPDSTLPQ